MFSGAATVNDRTESGYRDICFQSYGARSYGGAGTGGGTPGPWSIELDGSSAMFSNCMYMRGPVTHSFDDITVDISGSGTVYLGVKISTSDDTVEVIQSSDISEVRDSYEPDDPAFYKILLYQVNDDDGDFKVTVDYRAIPAAMLYI